MPRSLIVRADCIAQIKSCLLRNGFPSQKILAENLGLSQSTVSNFLNGRPVDFINFQELCVALGQEWREIASLEDNTSITEPSISTPQSSPALEIPEGQVCLSSPFYINRPPIEQRCYETIIQPGALVRISAPRQFGKTSLMARILHHAQCQGTRAVTLSLQLAERRVFESSNLFLQWFCASVSQELDLVDAQQLTKYAQLAQIIGDNQSCKAYFEQYLLPALKVPLTLGVDDIDRVFDYPEIAEDFLGLLRSLHEEAKRREIWKNLRLVIAHSTEVYIPLDVNKSPFNVGLPVKLSEFETQHIQQLAQRHGLGNCQLLQHWVGGHPYLLRLGMYHLACGDLSLEKWAEEISYDAGVYGDRLRRYWWNLEREAGLIEAMRKVAIASEPVLLPSLQAVKLYSLGLVEFEGSLCQPRCRLFQDYFRDRCHSK
ncbi:MAG: AAA-like domain-containing protein [Cyanobacteriota bacterium]|nr:AAA-like domain-containing protein [Cyanobacteriota bacterium]